MQDRHNGTVRIQLNIHPGQHRVLEYIAKTQRFGFADVAAFIRWCICYGVFEFLRRPPHPLVLNQAKQNIWWDEEFEGKVLHLLETFHTYLAAGAITQARELVEHWRRDALNQPDCFWRDRHLKALEEPLRILGETERSRPSERPCAKKFVDRR
jgi:hypothetical protein